ncbi:hypothetical protein PsYK624_071350 [Phanerochaete sordida]|uniref:Yeast cell wall synthesis Kre9/Knh1-like N-terminal domain-containing protein n=1 Tax=Phanerochaete sordida TaxID=48140 RepID=A0A9P3LE12_9APHY|nr:hypothetical protein PsYK624_071350 [Phanerochaete sordida]
MLSLFITLFTISLALSGASAAPTSALAARGLYSPSIASPDANTVWGVGKSAVVSWDTSKVPNTAENFDAVTLYTTASDGTETLVSSLSTNFSSHAGAVGFTVPQSVAPGTYYVKIGSSSSDKFQVAADPVVYLPDIQVPTASTTWAVGDLVSIQWDYSSAPANPAQLPYVDLYTVSPSGGTLFVARLASNVDVKAGKVQVDIPQVRAGKYLVMVGGYGHNSAQFTITA